MAEGLSPLCAGSGATTSHLNSARPPLRVRLVYGMGGGPNRLGEKGPVPLGEAEQPGLHLQADFSLTARQNVLFGASGVGKSTLLRLLAGLFQPVEGVIARGAVVLTDTARGIAVPAGRRGIGYLTQEPALFPHLNTESNIAYGLDGLSRAARRARVSAMLGLFSLESLARRMPERLSGGERQRVALARALAPAPALLLLDEAFAGLDASLRQTTTAALDQYLEDCQTVVLAVSHDVAEVYASKAEVLLMEHGRIAQQGPAHVVLAPHRNRLLRRLGAVPIEDSPILST